MKGQTMLRSAPIAALGAIALLGCTTSQAAANAAIMERLAGSADKLIDKIP